MKCLSESDISYPNYNIVAFQVVDTVEPSAALGKKSNDLCPLDLY